MRVKCVICDNIGQLPDDLPLAKTLRNRPIHTYMCQECNDRIAEKTIARIETGNFTFYRSSHSIEKEF
ncbi:YlaI family protein [Sporosarcina sp. E16_8]|uniref:YlaI family protein n=1 Tax=Sporosarcina sp. E16_8 TaxID=2789295 RepID=UPI001A92D3E8|nr:YlaI family protein [Sporosarcina sp. E16_8]MBO0585913.1 YlaI family protein [Sporosarcina sp. E16_8]